jgi:hypothetical protein
MDYQEVTRVSLFLDGWKGPVGKGLPAELLPEELLSAADHLIVMRAGEPPYRSVFGVPHHAAPGAAQICEQRMDAQGGPNPREADENAALYALAAFAALAGQGQPTKLVIMAHPTTHDPNKVLDSPYCREIFAERTSLLFECHGSRHERRLDLELSAGRNPIADTLAFGRLLAQALKFRYSLGVQREPGKRRATIYARGGDVTEGDLELPAHNTHSLVEAGRRGVQALHLEARPRFRSCTPQGEVSEEGMRLGVGIAISILRYLTQVATH